MTLGLKVALPGLTRLTTELQAEESKSRKLMVLEDIKFLPKITMEWEHVHTC